MLGQLMLYLATKAAWSFYGFMLLFATVIALGVYAANEGWGTDQPNNAPRKERIRSFLYLSILLFGGVLAAAWFMRWIIN